MTLECGITVSWKQMTHLIGPMSDAKGVDGLMASSAQTAGLALPGRIQDAALFGRDAQ